MARNMDNLNRLITKLTAKYGAEDSDVVRLQAQLDELKSQMPQKIERQARHERQYSEFRSEARKNFYLASKGAPR